MINEEKTKIKFGYISNVLKPESCKIVVWNCNYCGIAKEKKYREAKRVNLCILCSNTVNATKNIELRSQKIKDIWARNGHPRKGKTHSEESKKAISKSRKGKKVILSEEVKEKFRQVCIRRNKSAEHISKVRNSKLGKPLSSEHKAKISLNHADVSGEKNPAFGKVYNAPRQKYISKSGKSYTFRSSWELKYAKYLDDRNKTWDYECKTFPVKVIWNGISVVSTYTPDFYLLEENTFIEIKGYWRERAKIKFEAFQSQYQFKILVLEKEALENLGILL